ncbi:MAG: NADH-quinone oxidoreductase subunit J [Chloroflexi bacterium]|nr:NADH-quinone oxidoreductase subunit J [Chloroflexota bacterium]
MDAQFVALLLACIVAVLAALAVVLTRRPVYAAVGLLAHTLSLAALFAILGAGLVAIGQVLIYSGAIVVLFLFVVTLLPLGGTELPANTNRVAAAIVGAGALLAALAAALGVSGIPASNSGNLPDVPAIGMALFGPVEAALELTVPLLLTAIVAAVVIWRRHEPRSRHAPTSITAPDRELVLHR